MFLLNSGRFGAAVDFSDSVFASAAPATSTYYITRTSSALYKVYYPMAHSRWMEVHFDSPAGLPGSYTPIPHQWRYIEQRIATLVVDDLDLGITYSGLGWSILSGNHRTSTTGDYAEWTTPANSTTIGLRRATATNCGYALVTVNGSNTAANRCPTAQEEVDAGRLASTVLVANGGTLNPTDRVMEFYTDSISNDILLVDELSPGAHTVRLTNLGYKRAASSDDRITIDAFFYGGTPNPSTSSVYLYLDKRILSSPVGSALEFAYRMTIGGTTEWAGNVHGYEKEISWVVTLDGTPTVMTDGQTLSASTVLLDKVTELYHPNHGAGATKTADTILSYTFDTSGFRIQHSTTWLTAATPESAYAAMLPAQDGSGGDRRYVTNSRGSGDAIITNISLDVNGGVDIDTTIGESATMWMWTSGGKNFMVSRLANEATTLQNYTYAGTPKTFLQDRTGSAPNRLNKGYYTLQCATGTAGRAQMPNVAIGTVWTTDFTVRYGFSTSADTVCSR